MQNAFVVKEFNILKFENVELELGLNLENFQTFKLEIPASKKIMRPYIHIESFSHENTCWKI